MGLIKHSTVSWANAWRGLLHPKVLTLLLLGFSAGLPILLIFSSLSIWLREAGIERSAVTFFSWAALAYSFKFVWAPLVDRLPLPLLHRLLGRRRSWLLLSQLAIMGSLLFMSWHNPAHGVLGVAIGAVMLGFSSATQDIVIDAYRIEAANEELQAMMSSAYIAGYRVGMMAAGAGALALASWFTTTEGYDYQAWAWAYRCMAGAMLVGILTTLCIKEQTTSDQQGTALSHHKTSDYVRLLVLFAFATAAFAITFSQFAHLIIALPQWMPKGWTITPVVGFALEAARLLVSLLMAIVVAWIFVKRHLVSQQMVQEAYVAPFTDFFQRYGKLAIYLLLLISIYRISDIVMGTIANVFYSDMGYSKAQIATITKTFGLGMTITGGFLGGVLALRYGVMRILLLGGWLVALTNMLFAILAGLEPYSFYLILVIAADNLSGGIASAAFIAFLSGLTNRAFTAMQYAIFSSMMTLLPKLLAGYSGTFVDVLDYPLFFIFCAVLGLPVVGLVYFVTKKLDTMESAAQ